MSLIPITGYDKPVAFAETPREKIKLRYTFPIFDPPPEYPSRGVISRIIYHEDGTIRAEFYPVVCNYGVHIARWIPWSRWRQTGEGIWLGAEVNEEEADYIMRLTNSPWSEGGECVVIGPGDPVHPEAVVVPGPEPEKGPDPIARIEFKCRENSDQLMLF
jgi:hypothetical protein